MVRTIFVLVALGLGACTHTRPAGPAVVGATALVGTTEVREYFGVSQDTFPLASDSAIARVAVSTAINGIAPLGYEPKGLCGTTFHAVTTLLVYVAQCPSKQLVLDGDALVAVSLDGRTLGKSLLVPGGIDFIGGTPVR